MTLPATCSTGGGVGLVAMAGPAAYACAPQRTLGRRFPEPPPRYRSEYQRDRDRIVHCNAFRRLEYKTQVFVNHEGDMFRTRLTHSLEVAQIARSAARALRLNEDLTEAICLAHDLGHTPFGHAGQSALDRCMSDHGGFEHNLQSLRVVDRLEERYAEFPGLNLTYETREGILKHCSRERAAKLGDIGRRFLEGTQPSLEAQLANVCDELAYHHHDIDDGVRAGLIQIEDLLRVAAFQQPYLEVTRHWPDLDERRTLYEVIRRMIDRAVCDLVETTSRELARLDVSSVSSVRGLEFPLAHFSEPLRREHAELKRFLHERMYRHHRVHRMAVKSRQVIENMFTAFMGDDRLLPPQPRRRVREGGSPRARARAIADYIAGMTDRFAIAEHRRLFDPAAPGYE